MLVLFVASCNKQSTEPTDSQNAKNYFPLEVGNYWIYRLNGGEKSGKLDTVRVIGTKIIEEKKYFVLQQKVWYSNIDTTIITYMRNEKDISIIRSNILVGDTIGKLKLMETDIIDMNFSLKPNEFCYQEPNWSSNSKSGSTIENISIDTICKVEAKIFSSCICARRYMNAHFETNFISYYASSVGLVLEFYPVLSEKTTENYNRMLVSAFVGGKHYGK